MRGSWLPIVHTPHGAGHAREARKPGGPGVVLVATLANGRGPNEEESEDQVEGDEDQHDPGHCAQVNPGDSAGRGARKDALYEGERRIVWRKLS